MEKPKATHEKHPFSLRPNSSHCIGLDCVARPEANVRDEKPILHWVTSLRGLLLGVMKMQLARLLPVSALLLLASCGQTTLGNQAQPTSSTPTQQRVINGSIGLGALAVAATTNLTVGQTVQFNVTVGTQPAQPGQLRWTTTNAGVATVTQTGLVTAKAAGNATVRAALATNLASFVDFPLVVGAATPPSTPTSTYAQRVLDLTNAARTTARTCGTTAYAATSPLTYNALLEKSAQAHATDMATRNYFSHTSQDGRTFAQRITGTGYTWTRVAENIAAGYATPETVVSGWLSSAGHCANIMNPALKELGVGYAQGGTYGYYWVQDFGTR